MNSTPPSLNSRILVTGGCGLVGSSIVRRLRGQGFSLILAPGREEMDLRDQAGVDRWFDAQQPEYVYHVAGKVGGILANSTQPADFLYDNILLHATVLRAAWRTGVKKLLYLGSSCIYPRDCPQPIKEEYLMTGPLEKTNDAYAIAKISGLMSCDAYRRQYGCHFISAMPTNLYGPNDNFHPEQSHVLPGLIRRFHDNRQSYRVNPSSTKTPRPQVTIWGTGSPRREFLHVDDLASACQFLMEHHDQAGTINVGTGEDVTIRELAESIRDLVFPEAELIFDTSKPDGTPRKILDVSRLHNLGWKHTIALPKGLRETYAWYQKKLAEA